MLRCWLQMLVKEIFRQDHNFLKTPRIVLKLKKLLGIIIRYIHVLLKQL